MSSKSLLARDETQAAQVWVPKGIIASDAAPKSVASQEEDIVATLSELPLTPIELSATSEPALETSRVDEHVLDRAREEAYALGLAEGRRQIKHAAGAERETLTALIKSLEGLRGGLQATLAEEVLSLALELAKQLLRQTLSLHPEAVLPMLREAMRALPGLGERVVLHLHPDDAALIRPVLEQDPTMAQIPWSIAEDARIERGGCKLETPQSEVDATLATRWSRVVAALGSEDSWHSSTGKA